MEKSHRPYKFCIVLLPSPWGFIKLTPSSCPIFWDFHPIFPSIKKGLQTMYINLKICWIIFISFCVFPLEHFHVFFKCFYCRLSFLIWFFVNIFPQFYYQIKHKAGNSFYLPTNNKRTHGNSSNQTKLKACSVSVMSNFRISCVWHCFILRII